MRAIRPNTHVRQSEAGGSPHDSSASASSASSSLDHAAGWWANRIFNDRELDHGILMLLLAIWIALFSNLLSAAAWWAEVFHVLPPAIWVLLLGGIGSARLLLSSTKFGHNKKRLATVALISCFLFGFMSFLVGIVRYQMSVTPLFLWLSYQSAKSYLRLSVVSRSHRPATGE